MNRRRHKRRHLTLLLGGVIGLGCLSTAAIAQYPFYGPGPGYGPPYNRWYSNHYGPYRAYGYMQPRWQVRGYINRYGDYQFDVKLRNVSKQDMYRAWLMYRAYGGQR